MKDLERRPRRTLRTAALVLVVGALGLLAGPTGADAAFVSVDTTASRLDISAPLPEQNLITVTAVPGFIVVEDTGAPPIAGSLCAPVAADPDAVQCQSSGVLFVSALLFEGNDQLRVDESVYAGAVGSVTAAVLQGMGGDDTLTAGSGTDRLLGANGNDTLIAGGGDDFVAADDGNDTALGGEGADQISGSGGDDQLDGGAGDDELGGGPGADISRGGDGADRLETATADALVAVGPDVLEGGSGPDTLDAGAAGQEPDAFSGGDGDDTLTYAARGSPVTLTLNGVADDGALGEGDAVGADIERLVGGSNADTIVGDAAANDIDGGPGDDLISGLAGDDLLAGGANDGGSDSLDGGDGSDRLEGGAGDDSAAGGGGADNVAGGGGSDTAAGDAGDDEVAGGPGLDAVNGGAGNDVLFGGDRILVGADGADDMNGGDGNDQLFAGPGNDRLDGGFGADGLAGEAGRDSVSYEDRGVAVTVTLDGLPNDGEPGENDNVGSDVENILGGTVSDTLSGDAGPNALDAGSGDDLIVGGASPDRLNGGSDSDVLRVRDGERDLAACGEAVDLVVVDRFDTVRDCEWVDRAGKDRPARGKAAVVRPTRGMTAFRLPAANRFVTLQESLRLPIGSAVDARAGSVRVRTSSPRRRASQRASFSDGTFTVRQRPRRGAATVLRLAGGDFDACGPASARVAGRRGGALAHAAADKPVRRLWGRVGRRRGKFRTRGRYSSGTVRGTVWLTVDRCDGTLTRVVSGSVRVHDFARDRVVVVDAGERYLARAPSQ